MVNLRDIIRENDLMGEVTTPTGGVLTRSKIDSALLQNGYTLPLPNKVSFHLLQTVSADMYLVTWFPTLDKYGIEKLTLK